MTDEQNPTIADFSDQLAAAVDFGARSIVAVHARPRLPSTGVHWRDGLIVTTDATVRREDDIQITLPGGKRISATVQGRDASSDLAVLRIPTGALPVASLGIPTALRPGHIVLALARLDDLGPRVSFGAVSSVGGSWRTWKGAEYDLRLQSGVTLYPGFGGGPLIDAAGKTHGINSGGLSRAFATTIPAGAVERVLAHLTTRGYVPSGWLGVGMQAVTLTPALGKVLGRTTEEALLITTVQPDGPGAAGLYVGDLILGIGGREVTDPDDIVKSLGPDSVGQRLALEIARGGSRKQVELVIGERPRQTSSGRR